MSSSIDFPVKLFYSYSHADESFRSAMEKSLSLLRRKRLIKEWSDHKILPGQSISTKIKRELEASDIIVFLLSNNFIASDACIKEWEDCKNIDMSEKLRFRIPIILSDCSWKDLLENDDIKALPKDGRSINAYQNQDTAWNEVYEGIKQVVTSLQKNFSPKTKLLQHLENTEFVSQDHIKLNDIFIFPTLSCTQILPSQENLLLEDQITDIDNLLSNQYVLLHGEDMSGKSTLSKHVVSTLIEQHLPVLFVDLKNFQGHASDQNFHNIYRDSFNGDYNLWKEQLNKTLVLDNLTSSPSLIRFVESSKKYFEKIFVSVSSDVYRSFYWDDERLAKFEKIKIEPLTHIKQENLIRKRIELMHPESQFSDGKVDEIEGRVNSVINKRILPRYPFYVLTVIQTFEGFMPKNLSVTTHGHCYHVLILAKLIKAGISENDDDINACLNFAEHLSIRIYEKNLTQDQSFSQSDFENFVNEYRSTYIIPDSILSRLKHIEYGILSEDGQFRTPYMYYFFLGMYLAKPSNKSKEITEKICQFSHTRSNHLILQFIIHHAIDDEIIDSIQLWTMCAIEEIKPANLSPDETGRFRSVIASLKSDMLSENDVSTERKNERQIRDIGERQEREVKKGMNNAEENIEAANDIYRILKNNELFGHILNNRYGRLKKDRIEEMVETIADGGLRLVNWILSSEEEISILARYVKSIYPETSSGKLEKILRYLSFIWTMHNIESIVRSIRHKEIREIVSKVADKKGTPAYDIIQYFSTIDTADELNDVLHQRLSDLISKHNDPFISGVLSLRTQHYINTHRSKATVEQKFCSLLGLTYRHHGRRS